MELQCSNCKKKFKDYEELLKETQALGEYPESEKMLGYRVLALQCGCNGTIGLEMPREIMHKTVLAQLVDESRKNLMLVMPYKDRWGNEFFLEVKRIIGTDEEMKWATSSEKEGHSFIAEIFYIPEGKGRGVLSIKHPKRRQR